MFHILFGSTTFLLMISSNWLPVFAMNATSPRLYFDRILVKAVIMFFFFVFFFEYSSCVRKLNVFFP